MSLLKETTLRYRAEGHLRFDLPASLTTAAREEVASTMRRRSGIYRVDLAASSGKLSLRFQPELLSFNQVLEALAHAIKSVASTHRSAMPEHPSSAWGRALSRGNQWWQTKAREARETAAALRIVARHRLGRPSMPPGAARTVLNDLLIIYLIKTHWSLIYRFWLRQPFEHKNHWVALSYLVFLLLRARRAHLG
jgi:hypothetical protein